MCARRRRSKNKVYRLERLGEFLPGALVKEKIYIDTIPPDLVRLWSSAVGPQIARQTNPVRFRNGTLSIKVSTSAWMQQLQFLREEIMEKVNAAGPMMKIKKIHFSLGQVPVSDAPDCNRPGETFDERHLRKRDRRLIEEHLSLLRDEDLKETLRRVMIREALTRNLRS